MNLPKYYFGLPSPNSFGALPHFDWYHKEKEALERNRRLSSSRVDRTGKPIAKDIGKQHKICFKDEVSKSQSLQTVYIVENYKDFNVRDKHP